MSEPVALLPSSGMGIYKIWNGLFQSGIPETPEDWEYVFSMVDVVVSLHVEGAPNVPEGKIHIRWPIDDGPLPDLNKLGRLATAVAGWVEDDTPVLVHCAAGINRSSLLTALATRLLTGESGYTVAEHVKDRKPGTLINFTFGKYLAGLPPLETEVFPELESEEGTNGEPTAAADEGDAGTTEAGQGGPGDGGSQAPRGDVAADTEASGG